jgi:hypothetical protein
MTTVPAGAELVGRDEELAAIDRFVDDRAVRTLVLEGEAGIGKTTLWLAGIERAAPAVNFESTVGWRRLHAQSASSQQFRPPSAPDRRSWDDATKAQRNGRSRRATSTSSDRKDRRMG